MLSSVAPIWLERFPLAAPLRLPMQPGIKTAKALLRKGLLGEN
jgi:hypothetical protein